MIKITGSNAFAYHTDSKTKPNDFDLVTNDREKFWELGFKYNLIYDEKYERLYNETNTIEIFYETKDSGLSYPVQQKRDDDKSIYVDINTLLDMYCVNYKYETKNNIPKHTKRLEKIKILCKKLNIDYTQYLENIHLKYMDNKSQYVRAALSN
jgi:hypothetical protein